LTTQIRKGSRLGKYRVERRLGRGSFAEVWKAGSFAEVWKARDTVEHRVVALKVAHANAVIEWGRDAIEHEARIASRLRHDNIMAVQNADWIEGRFIIATDLAVCNLEGYGRARRSGRIALDVIRQIAAGLAHAHSQRVMHRDVKPENILIFSDGRAALGDFGASRFSKGVTRTYTEAGTLGYMAPEQAYGRVRFTSDVFSLGLIAYELLTGVLPTWPFEWPPEGYERYVARVPEPVRPALRKAAEFDPRRRYPDAGAFLEALEKAFARVEPPAPRRKTRRRRKHTPELSPLEVQAEAFRRARGKSLDLRYRCHRCDGPIAESMTYCPWCGTADNAFAEITRYPLVCPECERGVRAEWTACPWCFKGRFEGNGRKPPFDPLAERTCGARGCEGQLRPFMPGLRGAAAPLHALLPALQAQGQARVVAPRSAGPLSALPLAHLSRLPALLLLVWEARTARRQLHEVAELTGRSKRAHQARRLSAWALITRWTRASRASASASAASAVILATSASPASRWMSTPPGPASQRATRAGITLRAEVRPGGSAAIRMSCARSPMRTLSPRASGAGAGIESCRPAAVRTRAVSIDVSTTAPSSTFSTPSASESGSTARLHSTSAGAPVATTRPPSSTITTSPTSSASSGSWVM